MNSIIGVAIGIAAAGAVGTLLRVLITDLDGSFNRQLLGTLAVNVVGSFGVGVLSGYDSNPALIIGIGTLGALTTFSTFVSQVERLDRDTGRDRAAAYVLISVIGGVAAALLGISLTT